MHAHKSHTYTGMPTAKPLPCRLINSFLISRPRAAYPVPTAEPSFALRIYITHTLIIERRHLHPPAFRTVWPGGAGGAVGRGRGGAAAAAAGSGGGTKAPPAVRLDTASRLSRLTIPEHRSTTNRARRAGPGRTVSEGGVGRRGNTGREWDGAGRLQGLVYDQCACALLMMMTGV